MTTLADRTRGEPTSIFAPSLRVATGGLVTLITMIAFEGMAVGPALPSAARELHGVAAYGWAFTAFLTASVVGMVLAGQVCDSAGPRRPLAAGMVLFVAGLVIAGTATSMAQLVASRAVQGVGGGLLITSAYVVIGETYPERLRPKVFAATSSAWLVPSLVGPAVSGALAQHVSWRWVFLGLVPFVLIGVGLMVPVLGRMHSKKPTGRLLTQPARLVRALVVAAGVSLLEASGHQRSWLAVLGAVAGCAIVAVGVRGLLPPGTFRVRPGVAAPIAMRGLLSGAFFGIEAVIPLMLSQQHGVGATAAGLPLACAGITWTIGSWFQGRAAIGYDGRVRARLLRIGFGCVAAATLLIGVTALPSVTPWLAYPAWLVAGLGAGLVMPTSSVLMLKHTTDADRGADSAALQLCDTTLASVTTGIAGVLIAAAVAGSIGYTAAFVSIAVGMALVALVGVAVSGQVRTVGS